MSECYAQELGDCGGRIENEHYISMSLQRMLGKGSVEGFPWQHGSPKEMSPGGYGGAHVICRKHHDALDGLDGVATGYFRNFMLMANKYHQSSGAIGRVRDITTRIDGRALERWCLKNMCGAIAAKAVDGVREIPPAWVDALFEETVWPDEWALWMATGRITRDPKPGAFNFQYVQKPGGMLNGMIIKGYGTETVFAIESIDDSVGLTRRVPHLRARIERPDRGDILEDLPAGSEIDILFSWN